MNELEKFIVDLNKIQLEINQNENKLDLNFKLNNFLLNGFGWNLLKSIYNRNIEVSNHFYYVTNE